MSDETQKPPLSSQTEEAGDFGVSSDWITDENGNLVLSPKAIERAYQQLLRRREEQREFQKKEDPYGDKMSLRKKPEALIEPRDKLGSKIENLYTYQPGTADVDFKEIVQRLVNISPNQAITIKEILVILTSSIPQKKPVIPSTDLQHPKTDFQSSTIPPASFEDRNLK